MSFNKIHSLVVDALFFVEKAAAKAPAKGKKKG